MSLEFENAKILKSAKILNSEFLNAKILKAAKILNLRCCIAKIFNAGFFNTKILVSQNLEFTILEIQTIEVSQNL